MMAECARRIVVVADSAKLGAHAFARICPASAIDTLITDDAAPGETVTAFEAEGVTVQLVRAASPGPLACPRPAV